MTRTMNASAPPPGLIIAAPKSASGKTVITLGLLRHLSHAGTRVASFKAGPDYIDPAFHGAAGGRASVNLDSWAMRPATIRRLIAGLGGEADLIIGEGVMGLFDGANVAADETGVAGAEDGSTAALSAMTGWPVVLVMDVKGQGATAAAVLQGLARHRTDVAVTGVIFNRVGSANHERLLRDACSQATPEIAVLGAIPADDALGLQSRHLGLVLPGEIEGLDASLDRAAALIARHVDVAGLTGLARPASFKTADERGDGATAEVQLAQLAQIAQIAPLGQRIAVAADEAFAFAYPALLTAWREAGAEVRPFSPLADQAPAADADAVYLPGGYPELHGPRLAGNGGFLGGLRAAAARGAQLFGECGGYMVLGRAITDEAGGAHEMAGLLPLETSFNQKRLHLGYRQVTLAADDTALGAKGTGFRGHEFHYARTVNEGPGESLFEARNAAGDPLGAAGLRLGSVSGSFIHLIDRADAR